VGVFILVLVVVGVLATTLMLLWARISP